MRYLACTVHAEAGSGAHHKGGSADHGGVVAHEDLQRGGREGGRKGRAEREGGKEGGREMESRRSALPCVRVQSAQGAHGLRSSAKLQRTQCH
eukprot:15552-Rhodomonas_salina.3